MRDDLFIIRSLKSCLRNQLTSKKIQLKKNLQNSFRGINVGHNIPWSTLIEKRHKEVQSSEISKSLDGLLNKSAYKIRYSGKKDELSSLIYESITKKLS
ncbi:hypothetical protein EFN40_02355 [Pediococcus parvulus]|nr:hypothetical protein [Pediococcus parvulus]